MSYHSTRQHYVPRLFLKSFASKYKGKRGIWVFSKGKQAPEHVNVDDAAAAIDYYRSTLDRDDPDALDKLFQWAESRVEPILDALRSLHQLPEIKSREWAILRRFLLDLMIRSPRMRQQFDPWAREIVQRALAEWLAAGRDISVWQDPNYQGEDGEHDYMTELIHRELGHVSEVSDQTLADIHALANRGPKPHIEEYLDRRYWRVLKPVAGAPLLITTDDPVVVHDDKGRPVSGLRNVRSRVTVVLSPRLVLQGCYTRIHRPIVEISALETMKINWIMASSAYREIFAREETFQYKRQAGKGYTEQDWFRIASSPSD